MFTHKATFKRGATSIYVVVISTLLFSVITFSFIRIIINETAKTTSDELAQSAYDSALAGVEDAKTALKRYYECKENTGAPDEANCPAIISALEERGFVASDPADKNFGYCDAVPEALGRVSSATAVADDTPREVLIQEQTKQGGDRQNIVQAYTCVIVDNTLDDYRSTLSASTPIRVIPLKTESDDVANTITGLRIFWYSEEDGALNNLTYTNADSFHSLGGTESIPTPPTISAQIIQTASEFKLDQFNTSSGSETNRGTVILTPTDKDHSGSISHISADTIVLSNNHDYSNDRNANEPQKIKCGLYEEFACSTTIELPKPIGGSRAKDTFYLVLSLPYGGPTTTFSIQLCNDESEPGDLRGDCSSKGNTSIAQFKDAQISVDSTGRANDIYSRVEARVEFNDIYFPYPEFAIQTTGSGDTGSIRKNFYVTEDCMISTDPSKIESCLNTNE